VSKTPGKRIGTLEVKLDRKKTRNKRASIDVELRFDISTGFFWAQYEGNWVHADTKTGLAEQIKVAATKALSLEWRRYIQISYEARGWPIEDKRSGRPATDGRFQEFDLGEDRSKYAKYADDENEDYVICGLELHWSICEISEPYPLPEDPKKMVRAKREINVWHYGDDKGKEKIGEPREWENADLPAGALIWTPEREAVLADIIGALGKLDARLVDLFAGNPKALADKIDAAAETDPSRLLAAPKEPAAKKRGRRS
jgi:hypothetical protein